MGYHLNSLANLPIDETVKFYVFVINGAFQEPLYEVVQKNFTSIARSIGNEAVIAQGLDPTLFTTEISEKYLGEDHNDYFRYLPALLITDTHPDHVSPDTMRLFVPLRDAERRFGGWDQFFRLLAMFVKGDSDEFVRKFREKGDWLKTANDVFSLNPSFFGFGININSLVELASKRMKRKTLPYIR